MRHRIAGIGGNINNISGENDASPSIIE